MLKALVKRAEEEKSKSRPYIVITKATTADNPHLDQRVKDDLFSDYGGTRLGRQELYAEILEDVEGALWTPEDIELWRINPILQPKRYMQIGVGVDPQAKEGGDSTGIVVVGVMPSLLNWQEVPLNWNHIDKAHAFVLADYSVNGKPDVWGSRVVDALNDYEANFVVAETNNGGEMVAHTIHTVDDTIPIRQVTATRGKDKRAEPVSALYQQGRGHHVGMHPLLEDEMTTWDAIEPDPSWSPDRMDALVWAATELIVKPMKARRHATAQQIDRRLAGRR
jgi:phage terminase large subunit-like protein